MKNKTLLVLAAGMGSRFGGLKQVEPLGPNGEFIIDYSIYDAIKAGFNKIVFVIKEENLEIFKNTIEKRMDDYLKKNNIEIEYIFQNLNNVPSEYKIPEDRIKPLGTAHAILCAKNIIHEPFMIINADDFYGYDAYDKASLFLEKDNLNEIGIVGYNVINTITENGSVKRGVCNIENGYLKNIVESEISVIDGNIKSVALSNGRVEHLDREKQVSMNMICFYPEFMNYIEKCFNDFLSNKDLTKDEYLIPDVITKAINDDICKVKIIDTSAKWVGFTYKEDKEGVIFYINSLIEDKKYPKDLWK